MGSSDIIFGAEAIAQRYVDEGIPPISFQESREQWIELFNRSDSTVNLGGWKFVDGIRFEFPEATELRPGEWIVIPSDVDLLAELHSEVSAVGEFRGDLSRAGERLELADASGNPVDVVHYHDGGRWPKAADGGGSSLELRDPDANNAIAEAWAASDESDATGWRTYSYRGTAERSAVGQDNQWRDFAAGLLSAGEILIDDISVIEEPDGAAEQLITNVDFNSNDTGWRLLGNHRHSEIIIDPESPGNKVLRLVATGPTEHMHNHLETTLNSRIVNGREYQISFRAKWISGSNQLHTRLYFNRLPRVNVIDRPLTGGTPGRRNSLAQSNIGPTFTHLSHSPVVPDANESTTIQAIAEDPDGVAQMTLRYSVNDSEFASMSMTAAGNGRYEATVPGQPESAIVHFYVTAEDGAGTTSLFPASGPAARAAYKVQDGNAESNGLQNFRIIVTNEDRGWMHRDINVMSNDRIPATVIVDEKHVYYDVGVRLKGSERARSQNPRVGFNVRFNADEKFRGIHETVSIDRSEGVGTGQFEMLFDVMISNSGGILSRYYDLIQLISPQDRHVGGAVLQLARYEDIFIDSQFGDGSEGTRYEYELIYYPTTDDANNYKRPQPDNVVGTNVRNLGDHEEDYRWNFLIKDDREQDNFEPIMAYAKHFSKRSSEFDDGLEEVVDVDNWLRGMAYAVLSGAGDNAGAGSQHNGMYYARPDGRVIFLPHDMDFAFSANRSITDNLEVQKIARIPRFARIYYGHLHDIAETTYNREYMQLWTDHFDQLLPRQRWSSHLSYINSRSRNVLSQVDRKSREIEFAVLNESPLTTDANRITIQGTGWFNVRKIRLAGSDAELVVNWTDLTEWAVDLPVFPGSNDYLLEALDFQENIIATTEIAVTGTGTISPASSENLRITEVHYHPADLSESEKEAGLTDPNDFEFLELANYSDGPIDLDGVRFVNGIAFEFDGDTLLSAGERVLLVRNQTAFEFRYPDANVSGIFDGGLANDGERITLIDALGVQIADVRYNDRAPWPIDADGEGYSLIFVGGDESSVQRWQPSATIGGTPGWSDAVSLQQWMTENEVADVLSDTDHDGAAALLEYRFGTAPMRSNSVIFTTPRPRMLHYPVSLHSESVLLTLEYSSDLANWQPVTAEATFEGLLHNRDDATATATWSLSPGHYRLSATLD